MERLGKDSGNLLNFMAMQLLTLYRPRLFFIEAGGSFDLLGDYCQSLGVSVNRVKINPKHPISLNPFSQGLKVLEQVSALNAQNEAQRLKMMEASDERLEKEFEDNINFSASEEADRDIESPDVLGDMVLAALTMITGGEKKEEERISRSDRMLIMDAILLAAQQVKAAGFLQMIAADIVKAFETIATQLDAYKEADKIKRAREMADSMRYFILDPTSSQFFNSYGEPWPVADVTIVDFGLFAQEGYEAQRSIAFAGVVGKMMALADQNQYGHRSMYAIFDENHLFSKLPLLAAIQTRIAKMGRKLGLGLWISTQNLKDFADESKKMLSLLESWICLALPPYEIDQIERFKPLTEEQRQLFLSARKSKGQYTEGVLLTPCLQTLFRNTPPTLCLAMAATEQHEKHERKLLMQKMQCSELEVVHHLSREMMKRPMEIFYDD